jgi:hypothetical protein
VDIVVLRRAFGWILFLVSLVIFGWGVRPTSFENQKVLFSSQELWSPSVEHTGSESDLDTEDVPANQLLFEFPKSLRRGDAGIIRMAFEPSSSENSHSAPPDSATIPPSEDNDVCRSVLRARLDLSGIRHTPTGEISQKLALDHPVIFLWNLSPEKAGIFNGNVWLHALCVPEIGTSEIGKVLAAKQVNIRVTSLFGLSGSLSRAIGGVGVFMGLTLGLEGWLFKLLKIQSERIKD